MVARRHAHPDADNVAQEHYRGRVGFLEQQELDEAVAALEAAGMEMVSPGEDYTGSTHTSIKTTPMARCGTPTRTGRSASSTSTMEVVYSGYCSASVLPNNLIVTAAHCTYVEVHRMA